MALKELFYGDVDLQRPALLIVLDRGLLAAEGTQSALWSGSDDLRTQFIYEGKIEPDWLDQVNPELATIYRTWVQENRARIEAVLKNA